MHKVNLNQAATSGTKPAAVLAAVADHLAQADHQNAGRGDGELAEAAAALEARMALAELFGCGKPGHVTFTSGVTESINMVLGGLELAGGHVITTSVEHNAVARPLYALQQAGMAVSWLPCAPDGALDPQAVHRAVRANTRLLVMTHASNVLGTVLPVAECFAAAKQHGLFTLLDAAQSAGHLPVTLDANTDVIAFTGHKGLRGLAGSGGLVWAPGAAQQVCPWKRGGTGSHSHMLEQPGFMPDKYEPGTQNSLGIAALGAAAQHLLNTGLEGVRAHSQALTARFIEGALALPLTVYGTQDATRSVPVVSVRAPGMDSALLARRLAEEYGVLTRSGLHCSPLAHRTAGTFPEGTLRFSFGADNTPEEIDYALDALERLLAG